MQKRILTISELNSYIKGVFDDELILHSLSITGEVEDFKSSGGVTYFTLKDNESRLSCVLFNRHEKIEVGTKIEVFGGVTFYKKTAKVSFVAKSIKLVGKALEHVEFLKLKEQLEKEGLFKDKKQMPVLIKRVALITSETGVVIEDFKKVFDDNSVKVDINIVPVKVQGANSAQEIIKAIKYVNDNIICDIVVIMRGGGSSGDLASFNDEKLARAVKTLKPFSISAIGHETDYSLVDLIVDLRCGTPSMAAALIAQKINETKQRVLNLANMLATNADRLYNRFYAKVNLASIKVDKFASQRVVLAEQQVKFLSKRLIQNIDLLVDKKQSLVATSAIKLDHLSPLKQLDKGFTRATKNAKPITSIKHLTKGDKVELAFRDGKVGAVVERVES